MKMCYKLQTAVPSVILMRRLMSSSQGYLDGCERDLQMEALEHCGLEVRVTWFQILPVTSKLCGFLSFLHFVITLNLNFLICKMEEMTPSTKRFLKMNEIMFVTVAVVT